jgi:acyl-CoA synthetase (AMP-forming)/AMP-acid ligase II
MNLGEILAVAARTRPDHPAVVDGRAAGPHRTYRELNRRADALATALVDGLGLRREDRVALMMPNGPELIEALFAVWQAGGAVVALDARATADEIVFPVNDSEARFLIAGAEFAPELLPLAEKLAVESIVVGGGGTADVVGAVWLDDLRAGADGRRPAVPAGGDDEGAWLASPPDATGRHAGPLLTRADLAAAAAAWPAELPPVEADDVGLIAAPLTHGAAAVALAFVQRAATMVTLGPSGVDGARFLSAVAEHRVTHAFLVPPQLRMVLEVGPGPGWEELGSLKAVSSGGGPLGGDDADDAAARFGARFVPLLLSGGLTVSPREIEDALLRHAGISQAVVVGVPDERWGQAIKAIVVPAPGARLGEAEVMAFAGAQLPGYKKPKAVEFAAALPEISPRGGSLRPVNGST